MTNVQIISDSKGAALFAVISWVDYQRVAYVFGDPVQEFRLVRKLADLPPEIRKRMATKESSLKVLREWRGLSQVALSGRSGVSSQYISAIESQTRKAGVHVLKKLAPALGIAIQVLLGVAL